MFIHTLLSPIYQRFTDGVVHRKSNKWVPVETHKAADPGQETRCAAWVWDTVLWAKLVGALRALVPAAVAGRRDRWGWEDLNCLRVFRTTTHPRINYLFPGFLLKCQHQSSFPLSRKASCVQETISDNTRNGDHRGAVQDIRKNSTCMSKPYNWRWVMLSWTPV